MASDEDEGGFFASVVTFNAVAGTDYQIAIDGYGGEGGKIVLSWFLEETLEDVPRIRLQPRSYTVSTNAKSDLDSGGRESELAAAQLPMVSQQRADCGGDGTALVLASVQVTDVGVYYVRVSNPTRFCAERAGGGGDRAGAGRGDAGQDAGRECGFDAARVGGAGGAAVGVASVFPRGYWGRKFWIILGRRGAERAESRGGGGGRFAVVQVAGGYQWDADCGYDRERH